MTCPEQWAEAAASVAAEKNLPLVVLGGATEPTAATEAVVAMLHLAGERFLHVDELHCQPRGVYVVTTCDARYVDYAFSPGTVVVDPFDYMPNRPGVSVFRPKMMENTDIELDSLNVANFDHMSADIGEF